MSNTPIRRTTSPKSRPAAADLTFGAVFTDHMFVMEYQDDRGWQSPCIEPYGALALDPAAMALHYGQAAFEGLKAYRGRDDEIRLFRGAAHAARLNRSCARLCIPRIDTALLVRSFHELLRLDADWVPREPGTALYLRPTVIASEPFLGLRPARHFLYYLIMSPVAPYYGHDHGLLKILVTDEYVRAVRGGMGSVKTGGNYAATLAAAEAAYARGFDQVLYLDGVHRQYVEEVGIMNIMVRIGDEIITPPLSDTILAGITRDCVLTLLRDWGVSVTERALAIGEILEAGRQGRLVEVWGTGTGATVAAIGELCYRGERMTIGDGRRGPITERLHSAITSIRYGETTDPYGWIEPVSVGAG